MNWKAITRLFCAAALWCAWAVAGGRTPDEVRSILETAVDTEYCGTAMMEGINRFSALQGDAPTEGLGFVRLEEKEWRPELVAMAKEEFETIQAGLEAQHSQAKDSATDERAQEIARDLNQRWQRLQRMLPLLGRTEGEDAEVDALLERIVRDSPSDADALSTGIRVWVLQAIRSQHADRCPAMGAWIREKWGLASLQHFEFYRSLFTGLALCRSDSERGEIARYLLALAEQFDRHEFGVTFDQYAATDLPGWEGSLQRKQLALRFADEPVKGRLFHYNAETGEKIVHAPTQRDVENMLWSRAAAELATEDSALTDLREVYGDWAQKAEEE